MEEEENDDELDSGQRTPTGWLKHSKNTKIQILAPLRHRATDTTDMRGNHHEIKIITIDHEQNQRIEHFLID